MLAVVSIFAKKKGKIHSYAKEKLKGFKWSGLTDFLNEIYLPMSFICGINTSVLGVKPFSVLFMSIFASIIGFLLVFWPFFTSISLFLKLRKRKFFPVIMPEGIEIYEGGELEENKSKARSKKKKKRRVRKKKKKAKKKGTKLKTQQDT